MEKMVEFENRPLTSVVFVKFCENPVQPVHVVWLDIVLRHNRRSVLVEPRR